MGHVRRADLRLEQFAGHVDRAADAGRAVGSRLGLGGRNEFLEGLVLALGRHDQHVGDVDDVLDEAEILHRVIGQRIEAGTHGVSRGGHQHAVIGIALGNAGQLRRGHRGAGTGTVLDDHGDTQLGAQQIGHAAGQDVRGATGGIRHHQGDVLGRPVGSLGSGAQQRKDHGSACRHQHFHQRVHIVSLVGCVLLTRSCRDTTGDFQLRQ